MLRPVTGTMVLGLVAVLAGCGGSQLNQTKLNQAQQAVTAAEAVGAPENPKAELHLQFARDEMAAAKRLAKEGEGDDSALLLDRAKADAELALTLAKTDQEQKKAREAWDKVRELRKQP
jgi:hypothetical protein